VTLIPPDFTKIECRVPLHPDLESTFAAKSFAPFCDEVMAFLQCLSATLLKDSEARKHPDVVSFAFWCRTGALRAMKEDHESQTLCLGRGIVFHIAPSNVPVNFAYSLATGLLAGNANIVRVPSHDFPQVEIICSTLRQLLEKKEFSLLRDHVVLVHYEKDDTITDFFSSRCDVRIIWGGDRTITDIRRSSLPPRSFDITFADRYSFCVINADVYLGSGDTVKIAQNFYNDTYLFDQNACTAPHLIVWLGMANNVRKAKKIFWDNLHLVVVEKYELQPVSAVDKYADAYRFVASSRGSHIIKMKDNLIVRVRLDRLTQGLEDARSRCGFFYEYEAKTLYEIAPLINRKFQTLAYYGLEPCVMRSFVEENRPSGIDRIVPIGRTLDFSLVWDGYDLIGMLSRKVSIFPCIVI
jgi:hypothetical protein